MRGVVIDNFPTAPGLPKNREEYLRFVDNIYKSDAYHSLSIEGYSVTPALLERVQRGDWDPDHHDDDRKNRDALTARGYWQAFQKVKGTIAEIIAGDTPGALTRTAHKEWYRELFQPCVAAGLIPAKALAGYRNDAIYLGYPWTVIPVRDRDAYLSALDRASIDVDIKPFTAFVAQRVQWSLEQHDLTFPERGARYVFDLGVVVFWGQDGQTHVRCAIRREALDDHFKGDNRDKLEVFNENRQVIEQDARGKYLAGDTEADGSILIRTGDL